MVRTRSTCSDEEKPSEIILNRKCLRSTKSQQDLVNLKSVANDDNYSSELNGKTRSRAGSCLSGESTSGRTSVLGGKFEQSDDSYNPVKDHERPTRMAYRNKIEDELWTEHKHRHRSSYKNVKNYNTQSNVRRSKRQRKCVFNSMDENSLHMNGNEEMLVNGNGTNVIDHDDDNEDDDDEDHNDVGNEDHGHVDLRKSSIERELRSRTKFINSKDKKFTRTSNELKRLGLPQKLPSDLENDMYSRIKSSRRKINNNTRDGGDVADTEDTEEISYNEIPSWSSKRLRRKRLSSNRHLVSSDETAQSEDTDETSEAILETRDIKSGYCLRPKRQASQEKKINSTQEANENIARTKQFRIGRFRGSYSKKLFYSHRRRFSSNVRSSTSESDSDEEILKHKSKKHLPHNRFLPFNLDKKDVLKGTLRDRIKVGSSLADIEPMAIDKSVMFDSVGGLDEHINALKEMALFPLLYPEVFSKYKIKPPRGVLFHGPPGTGKTLIARALANECSKADKKVAFFMRKGADCLSKWIGESERQLRLLFDQAFLMRPSIIFFDEIDGIAPVRSSRQDQIHSSIVSTLLALMDGLDDRGEVIVVGATNRIEAIDPALRRSGRFDREFYFPLPSLEARKKILTIHTKDWQPLLSTELLNSLALLTVGFCGADLKALCGETALISLRRRYPQVYHSKHKLVLNMDELNITLKDFIIAMKKLIPSTERSLTSFARPLNITIKPLLSKNLTKSIELINSIFPAAKRRVRKQFDNVHDNHSNNVKTSDSEEDEPFHIDFSSNGEDITYKSIQWIGNYKPRFLIHGDKGQGQTLHLAPSILHHYENVAHLKLDLPAIYSVSTRTGEESLMNIFKEAYKRLPAIIYMPHVNLWWPTLSDTLKATFFTIVEDLEPNIPLLLLATCDCSFNNLDHDLQEIFCSKSSTNRLLEMTNPTRQERELFFSPLFKDFIYRKPIKKIRKENLEELPIAEITDIRKLNDRELKKLRKKEENTLRELRLFLRDILGKLIKDRRFSIFVKPVDIEEVPDYLEIIEKPMSLETMMTNIDTHKYQCASSFLKDIELICNNALEYNPDRDSTDKLIRHRACALLDTANALIAAEMLSDFEDKCKEIEDERSKRGEASTIFAPNHFKVKTLNDKLDNVSMNEANDDTEIEVDSEVMNTSSENLSRKRQKNSPYHKSSKRLRSSEDNLNGDKTNNETLVNGDTHVNENVNNVELKTTRFEKVNSDQNENIDIIINRSEIIRLFNQVLDITENCNVEQLEEFYSTIYTCISDERNQSDRTCLEKVLKDKIDKFHLFLKSVRDFEKS